MKTTRHSSPRGGVLNDSPCCAFDHGPKREGNILLAKSLRLALVAVAAVGINTPAAWAKVSAEEAATLGKELTCIGAEKAGNKDGTIPAYSGKWLGIPAGVNTKGSAGHDPDPYASEKPLFEITAKNMEQYAERLSEGEKAMFKKYPDSFRMPVYPSHRDFRYANWICDAARQNALSAEVTEGGDGISAFAGAIPFPIPKSGLELLRNTTLPARAWKETATYDQAVVYPNSDIAWGRVFYRILAEPNDPGKKPRDKTEGVQAYANVVTLLPERNKGEIIISADYYNYKREPRQAWQYNPGTRRVRQLPAFGFDMPQGPGGFRTVDDDRLFNGSGERYNWKIVGKREVYIPYDTYRLNDPKVKYSDLLKPGHINPAYTRYELHRVWLLEGSLKEGYRHQYAKRVMYLDEDTWHAVMSDNYDARGQLWRVGIVNYYYAYQMEAFQAGVAVFHDLASGTYMADRLISEQPNGVVLNSGDLKPDDFTPDAARRAGH